MKKEAPPSPLKPGDFPFRLTHGACESPLLTWLRNHSNYMAVRGLIDYFRIAAILIRGVVVNSLVTLPLLLGVAIAIGLMYGTLLRDWDDQLAPAEARDKALDDLLDFKENPGKYVPNVVSEYGELNTKDAQNKRAAYDKAVERLDRRRSSATIHYFFTNLDTARLPIRRKDFENLESLAVKLSAAPGDGKGRLPNGESFNERPVDRWIWNGLSPETKTALAGYQKSKSAGAAARRLSEESLRDVLYEEFNLLLYNPYLYDDLGADFWEQQDLRPGTQRLIREWAGAKDVTIGGFPDLAALAYQLKEGTRPIDRWLNERLSPDTRKALLEYQGDTSDPRPLQQALAHFFEGVVRGPTYSFAFDGIELREPTTRLLKHHPRTEIGKDADDDRAWINHLIIEDAYPLELWWRVGGADLACLNRLLLEEAYPDELHRQCGGWVMWMQDHLPVRPPFVLTPVVLFLAVAWVLWFPISTVLARIKGYQRSLLTGSDSSVKLRDRVERQFAFALVAVTAVALFELLPLVVHFYHQFRVTHLEGDLPWRHYLATLGTIYSVLAGAQKLTSALSGVWRKLAVFAIGSLGLAAPFMVIVAATDFLIYCDLPATDANLDILGLALTLIPLLYTVLIARALQIGLTTHAFSGREVFGALKLWAQAVGCQLLIGLSVGVIGSICTALPESVSSILVHAAPVEQSYEVNGNLSVYFVGIAAVELLLFCWLTIDVNLTSVHGLYRDRLASAYLLRLNPSGTAEIEDDVPLTDLCRHDTDSTAPYHLINVALNLQASKDLNLRDRKSDFFIFSKKFVGGERTSYCRTVTMERVFPQLDLASAMAISAAAASPNMGRNTVPILVPLLTFINLRLGVWVPHPGVLAGETMERDRPRFRPFWKPSPRVGYGFDLVFREELVSVKKRWALLEKKGASPRPNAGIDRPTAANNLAGIGFSGGGIRSATVNLGIAQALHDAGVFDHFDYMSTVSGGGYLGSSISTFMRFRVSPNSEIDGTVEVQQTDAATVVIVTPLSTDDEKRTYRYHSKTVLDVKTGDRVLAGQPLVHRARRRHRSEIAGKVTVQELEHGATLVRITDDSTGESREYRLENHDRVCVKTGQSIKADAPLVENQSSFANRFRWRIRPRALRWEMTMRLDETHRWVNVSDGGHIENLAAIELLRRRCKLIVVGDGEADPEMHFNGLATLIRTAQIDLGIMIDINVDALRLNKDRKSSDHFAIGRITYPADTECGYLLYLKSSVTGDEGEVIWEYRHRSPTFPQESTADQFFDEGQFEAYRALGQHIGEKALAALKASTEARTKVAPNLANFPELVGAFESLREQHEAAEARNPTTAK